MAKKKTARSKHQNNTSVLDTSEEEINYQGKVCSHVQRGLNFARVKRILKSTNISVCGSCTEESSTTELPEVWLCLQCGNTGCGRMSTHRHAFQHFKTIHSDCHALVLSSTSGIVWCYECDDQVNLQQSRNLKQSVEFLTKSKGNKNIVEVKKSTLCNQQSLLETVLREQIVGKSAETKPCVSKNLTKNKKDNASSKFFIKGLRNLGNTCFFNAVMQSLNQTNLLYDVLEKICAADYIWEVPRQTVLDDSFTEDNNDEFLKIAIPRQFPLANSLLNFYKQMNTNPSVKSDVVNPSSLFSEIAKKAPQFKHFQEQDSHELLRQLLDGVRQDEVKRQKKAVLRHFDISNENVDEDTKKLIKAYKCYVSHTLVEKIFGGLFISTVLCEECKMSSQVFEPFMDMSLPLFEEKQQDNCDQPYLEGGQQQDFKPLRNRKFDGEENEYVLNKPKGEPGKPSKYQERKMKQLARKQRRMKRDIGKLVQVDYITQKENEENNEQNVADKTTEVEDKLECNGEEEGHISSVEEKSNISVAASVEETTHTFSNNDISITLNDDTESATVDETANTIEVTNESCSEEHQEMNPLSIENETGHCDVVELQFADESPMSEPCESEIFISNGKDRKTQEVNSLNQNADVASYNDGAEKQDITANSPLTAEAIQVNQAIETLVNGIENISLSSIYSLDADKKMQALGMQVKEIRIRCDSDRQDSLLDSSLSLDDDVNHPSCDSREDTCDNESEENWSQTFSESQTKEWILKSLFTLKPRVQISPNECSIDSCLTYFTKPELLTGSNKFRCEKCTEIKIKKTGNKKDVAYSNASKQLLIFSPPAILTLHLKRFQQVGMSLRKVNRFVEFPLILDLAPYCSSACQILPHVSSAQEEILYSLYGIVEHSGRMSSGHYTAYVKVTKRTLNEKFMCHLPVAQLDFEQLLQKFSKTEAENLVDSASTSEDYRWYYVSDNHVREVDESQVLRCQAYLLFYERIK